MRTSPGQEPPLSMPPATLSPKPLEPLLSFTEKVLSEKTFTQLGERAEAGGLPGVMKG